jgi:hypothetical protein
MNLALFFTLLSTAQRMCKLRDGGVTELQHKRRRRNRPHQGGHPKSCLFKQNFGLFDDAEV